MGTFWVDPDALSLLVGRIDTVVAAFDNAGQGEQGADAALGTSNLAGAYNDFISGWSDGRKQILANIKTLRDAASSAASAYLQAEGRISAAAQK